jgi:hypothetical protein
LANKFRFFGWNKKSKGIIGNDNEERKGRSKKESKERERNEKGSPEPTEVEEAQISKSSPMHQNQRETVALLSLSSFIHDLHESEENSLFL